MSSYAGTIKYSHSNPKMLAIGVTEQSQKLCACVYSQDLSNLCEQEMGTGKDSLKHDEQKSMRIVFEPLWELSIMLYVVVETPGIFQ